MAGRERPLVVTWESDTSGVQKGADEVIRTVEETEQKLADSGTRMGEEAGTGVAAGVRSKADAVGQSLADLFTVQNAMDMAVQYGQAIVDGIIEGLESRQQDARDALDAIMGKPGGEGASDEDLYLSALAKLGGGNVNQGALAAQRLGLSPAQIAAMGAGQVEVPGFASPLLGFTAAVTGAAGNLPGGSLLLESLGLKQTADAQAALALALDRNTAAVQAAGVGSYTNYGVLPGVNGAAPSTSPAWSNPWVGASGSASVPTRG